MQKCFIICCHVRLTSFLKMRRKKKKLSKKLLYKELRAVNCGRWGLLNKILNYFSNVKYLLLIRPKSFNDMHGCIFSVHILYPVIVKCTWIASKADLILRHHMHSNMSHKTQWYRTFDTQLKHGLACCKLTSIVLVGSSLCAAANCNHANAGARLH